jgi:hypothetical protein
MVAEPERYVLLERQEVFLRLAHPLEDVKASDGASEQEQVHALVEQLKMEIKLALTHIAQLEEEIEARAQVARTATRKLQDSKASYQSDLAGLRERLAELEVRLASALSLRSVSASAESQGSRDDACWRLASALTASKSDAAAAVGLALRVAARLRAGGAALEPLLQDCLAQLKAEQVAGIDQAELEEARRAQYDHEASMALVREIQEAERRSTKLMHYGSSAPLPLPQMLASAVDAESLRLAAELEPAQQRAQQCEHDASLPLGLEEVHRAQREHDASLALARKLQEEDRRSDVRTRSASGDSASLQLALELQQQLQLQEAEGAVAAEAESLQLARQLAAEGDGGDDGGAASEALAHQLAREDSARAAAQAADDAAARGLRTEMEAERRAERARQEELERSEAEARRLQAEAELERELACASESTAAALQLQSDAAASAAEVQARADARLAERYSEAFMARESRRRLELAAKEAESLRVARQLEREELIGTTEERAQARERLALEESQRTSKGRGAATAAIAAPAPRDAARPVVTKEARATHLRLLERDLEAGLAGLAALLPRGPVPGTPEAIAAASAGADDLAGTYVSEQLVGPTTAAASGFISWSDLVDELERFANTGLLEANVARMEGAAAFERLCELEKEGGSAADRAATLARMRDSNLFAAGIIFTGMNPVLRAWAIATKGPRGAAQAEEMQLALEREPLMVDLHYLYVPEALRRLRATIDLAWRQDWKWLRVICGEGKHSYDNVPKINPKVAEILVRWREEGRWIASITRHPVHQGTFVVELLPPQDSSYS